ncbi:MAG: acyltransferase family protein [Aeromicrobium erythreum]
MPQTPSRADFRPEVQALRAVAVLLVVLFHLWPGRLPGGYVGVDAFFVISGFLITAHLLREAEQRGRISLREFWARRARRLLPAAYLVLLVSAVGVFAWLPESVWQQNFREIIGSAVYVQNWVLAADAVDYLAADNAPSAVQHYWTLSVEEQFYLVWPLLVLAAVLLARRRGWSMRRVLVVVLGGTTAACFVYSLWVTATNPQLAYFASPARAWQFGAGALLAPWLARGPRALPATAASLLSWAGFAGLAACGLLFGSTTPFPGTAALAPVAATLAVILAGRPSGPLSPGRLMEWRPVQWLGDISYSLYLWHWPPIVILPAALGHELGLWPRVAILVGTILLAWLTKRYVEDPVRRTRRFGLRRPLRTGLATLGGVAVLVAVAGFGQHEGAQAEAEAAALTAKVNANMPRCFGAASMDPEVPCDNPRLDTMLVPNGTDVANDFADYPQCWADDAVSRLKSCEFPAKGNPDAPHVVLIGDSHARAMMPAFVRLADLGEISLTAQLKGGCAWTRDDSTETDKVQRQQTCRTWKGSLDRWIGSNASDIDLIVTTGYAKLLSGSFDDRVDGLVRAWRPAAERKIPIAALSDNPFHTFLPAKCLEREPKDRRDRCSVDTEEAFRYGDPFKAATQRVPDARSIDLTPFYCRDDECPAVIGGVNVYRDNSHLTITYTRTLAPYLLRELRRSGAL